MPVCIVGVCSPGPVGDVWRGGGVQERDGVRAWQRAEGACRRAARGGAGAVLARGESVDRIHVGGRVQHERVRSRARAPRPRRKDDVRRPRQSRRHGHEPHLHPGARRVTLSPSVGEGRGPVEDHAAHRLHRRRGEGSAVSEDSRQPAPREGVRAARHHACRLASAHPRRHDARACLSPRDEFVRPLVRHGEPRPRMGDLRQCAPEGLRGAGAKGQSEDARRHTGERPRLVREDRRGDARAVRLHPRGFDDHGEASLGARQPALDGDGDSRR